MPPVARHRGRSLSTWFEQNPPSRYVSALEYLVKGLNSILIVGGVALLAFSVFLLATHRSNAALSGFFPHIALHAQNTHAPTASTPTYTSGSIGHSSSFSALVITQPHESSSHETAEGHEIGTASSRTASTVPKIFVEEPAALSVRTWEVWVSGVQGFTLIAVASTAVAGAQLRSPRLITVHVAFLALLLSSQLCLAVAVLTRSPDGPSLMLSQGRSLIATTTTSSSRGASTYTWPNGSPPLTVTPTGLGALDRGAASATAEAGTAPAVSAADNSMLGPAAVLAHMNDYANAERIALRWAATALATLELAAMLAGCLLQSAYSTIEEAVEDQAEDEEEVASRRPLLV